MSKEVGVKDIGKGITLWRGREDRVTRKGWKKLRMGVGEGKVKRNETKGHAYADTWQRIYI